MFEREGTKTQKQQTGYRLCAFFTEIPSVLLNWSRIAPQTLQLYMSCSRKTLKWDVFYSITSVLYTNGPFY